MLLEAGLRNVYRRLNDVAAHIEQLGPDHWQVTIVAMHAGGWVLDEAVPMVDLGVFSTIDQACAVADLILETWVWDANLSGTAVRPGRPIYHRDPVLRRPVGTGRAGRKGSER